MEDSATIAALNRRAIDAALNCNWTEAIEINEQIIVDDPENIPCLNRMAKAYTELGKYSRAKKIYQEVLKLDPYNPIASKNLKRIAPFKLDENPHNGNETKQKLSVSSFLQEPGVTKIVSLVKVAEPHKLSALSTGMKVTILPKSRGITITDLDGAYLGVLPDDIAHLLLKFISGGNKYEAIVKSVKSNGLTVLLRETFRSRRFKNQPSFLEDSHYASYPSDHLSLGADMMMDDSPNESDETDS
ncbi:hypothetical protein A2631_03765 [Candidatus Daviesbacteria bacterium RIFCSPHIGHO2_01_FULL_44_29]|uniref:Uncharacterized protein n=1 Tax=Candidatus Daviesbacteria bacterium RIFCSPHIGHO2_02_FULL_43_12 TaxID=1797776 RepID=A0A1F5KI40_9BACT|nr:MAG: hypothetical protein A2631_03765 [Candidatus Daviesbacteria bacterium RIFCSPHIGHO2_01_FULL_44_29]OGE39811.1 MAG: hypothetical protein A3E86_04545 [Candidatus Daviesbacteria bacterium RIFCSPHIGHO2_12_FULL_47_45]OGE40475.1 MAG: hypothetical protein A3D25_00225 [Candidatus Daviesbacteria bacterium RIFCSPHIGHO2_02_FULL_43_12]OGE70026.1 MAG: hypothetical protein A3B55_05025 [Candidatus Daviesbacteria bacterium RIFCSPLOWO2_01_FULL_43_15]